tara:strand:+ start:2269 stop:3228 length:960 start_codon:yes stop_codon:yes gene_type:complete
MDFVNSKLFPYLVAISAGAVAFSAAFFSVFGLSKLFAGAQMSVVIMAGSLEFAKLVTASFLYRYWNTVPTFLRNYLLVGTLILIVITSAGIFGYLSNAYQGATTTFEKQSTVLMFKEDKLEQLNEDKVFLKKELEDAIAELPDNYRTARKKLREEYQPQITEINKQTLDVKQEIGDLKAQLVDTGVDVGPAIYLARVFNTEIDTVVKFFIFILIFVFDPLAVSLVIAANMAFELSTGVPVKKERKKNKKRWWEMYKEKQPKKVKPPKEDIPLYTEEDEERMDIIGQNGNEGIHYEAELPKGAVDLREINKRNEEKIKNN